MLISLHHQSIDFPNLSKSDRTAPSTLQRVSTCFSPVATRPNSLVGDRALTSSKFSVSRLPRILSRAALLLQKLSRTLSGSLVGYSDNRRARGGLRSLSETDCRARCRLRFSAFAQRKSAGLVSLCRRALPRCPTLALAQTFTVWRHSKFPLILVPPQLPRRRPRRLRWAALHPQRLAPLGR